MLKFAFKNSYSKAHQFYTLMRFVKIYFTVIALYTPFCVYIHPEKSTIQMHSFV